MVPNPKYEASEIADEELEKLVAPQAAPWSFDVTWHRVAIFAYKYVAACYGCYLIVTQASWATVFFNCAMFYVSAVSVCAGAHRLWTHRSYKATWPLQLFLTIGHCIAGEHTIFLWVRDHRLHHRYSDTDADPYNASRGFVFSHIGWTCVNRHPEVKKRGHLVDMSDIFANPIVMFQKRNKDWLNPLLSFVIPTLIPMYWSETFWISYHANMFRYMLSLNGTFSINSFAHMFGTRPYDKNIAPSQNIITNLLTAGEGFHNFHHAFPYDYKAGEFGSFLNFSAGFIKFCGKVGLAYDLREVSKEVLEQRMMRTGDGNPDKYGLNCIS